MRSLILLTLCINLFASFPKNYDDAKMEFFKKVKEISQNDEVQTFTYSFDDDQSLSMDAMYLPSKRKDYNKLLIMTSGIHGVEAYVGHAMQILFLEDYLKQINNETTSVLIIHSLNPYGFYHNRRTDGHNIDLNRNFVVDRSDFEKANQGYDNLYDFLNPKKIASKRGFFADLVNYSEIAYLLIRFGMKDLRQAILQGQYNHPYGIYYGGDDYQPLVLAIEALKEEIINNYKEVLHIDLHTGYGQRGKLHLFSSREIGSESIKQLETIFNGKNIDFGDDDDFYEVSGDFTHYMLKKAKNNQNYLPITFEYGTLDSQTTMGSIDSLNRVRDENQGHYFGYQSLEDKEYIEKQFREMFYPTDQVWRENIKQETTIFFDDIVSWTK